MFRTLMQFAKGSFGLLLLMGLAAGAPIAGHAAEEKKSALDGQKTRKVPSMSEAVFKKLSEAQEAVDAKDFATAKSVITRALERGARGLNGNEIGQFYNMLGFINFSEENYPRAVDAYKKVIAQGDDIPAGLETTTLYTLAQLSFVTENYDDALRYMETWIQKADNPGPEPHIFMGQVYYQKKDFQKAVVQIEKGISKAKERGTPVKEQWYALLNYLYFEKEDWPEVLDTLEILVKQWPKRDYWVRLAGIHGQEGNEREQLLSMEAAYIAGFLDREADLTNLSGLLMQAEVPYRAAKVLEKGMKDGFVERSPKTLRSLGQAWQIAQETNKAIPVFEDAAKLSDDGKIYDRLANLYLDADKFDACITAANNALKKGGLRKSHVTNLVKGMCLYNLEKLTASRKAFKSCQNGARRKKDDSNQRVCTQWITFIDREVARREALAKAI